MIGHSIVESPNYELVDVNLNDLCVQHNAVNFEAIKVDTLTTMKVELRCYNALNTPHCSSHFIWIVCMFHDCTFIQLLRTHVNCT